MLKGTTILAVMFYNSCSQAVVKLVKSLGVTLALIPQSTAGLNNWLQLMAVLHKNAAAFKQLGNLYTQLFLAFSPPLINKFYTLPTGPTNTTKLNKG